ncbi:MAG: Glucokinase [Candidatus Carbobacillus altaicus]|uniref:Glucokinase n=1 Tax=Candidatus Carbonibacillus altaicus TaxID=2163959 RepID=A0A2R6Y3X0_9BACL|nr:MAG: Glucokinase [Candidatus Carbobacillus altaicus]
MQAMNVVIGVDIGGTKLSAARIDAHGQVLLSTVVPTDARGGQAHILGRLYEAIDAVIDSDVQAIGIGTAGKIDVVSGQVVYASDNLPGWTGTQLKALVSTRYGLPVAIDNDVNAALLGERWLGAARRFASVVMLALGTGVGGAVLMRGALVRGHTWSAGEIGHMIFQAHGRPCNCGLRGCLEQYVSGTALAVRYNERVGANDTANDARDVFARLTDGDPFAIEVVDAFAADLALAIRSLQHILDPEAFIIGGGVTNARALWWHRLEAALEAFSDARPAVYAAELGNEATLYGAAKLALELNIRHDEVNEGGDRNLTT